jgi:hypothetical protein
VQITHVRWINNYNYTHVKLSDGSTLTNTDVYAQATRYGGVMFIVDGKTHEVLTKSIGEISTKNYSGFPVHDPIKKLPMF